MIHRIDNFSAGPSALPLEVLERARDELFNWKNLGVSVMELGHRTPEFMAMADKTENDLRTLLNIPTNYKVLFLLGGARVQFAMLPLNILRNKTQADYFDTGLWSGIAITEAQKYCDVNIAVSGKASDYWNIPSPNEWSLNPNAAYVHYTENETINGVEFHTPPDVGNVPLVCDMTSSLMCKPIDISRFGVIYAAAQKNLGIAGMTIVIIRDDLLGAPHPQTPTVYNYTIEAEQKSLYPTPPTFPWYMASLMCDWMIQQGGVERLYQCNLRKAEKLYNAIDNSDGFYFNSVEKKSRSRMNVTFRINNAELEKTFIAKAAEKNLGYLAGHKLAGGGMRASIYNAISEDAVDRLITFMSQFKTYSLKN